MLLRPQKQRWLELPWVVNPQHLQRKDSGVRPREKLAANPKKRGGYQTVVRASPIEPRHVPRPQHAVDLREVRRQ